MPRSRTASLIPAAAAAMGMGTSIALLLLLALSGGVAAFLSPHLPSSSGPSGRVAAGRTCVAPLGLHRIAGSPFLPQPARSQQPRLFASVDTEEKGKEEKAVAVVVDPKAQQELERLLAEGSDLLGLFEHLKAKRGQVKLTWEQVR